MTISIRKRSEPFAFWRSFINAIFPMKRATLFTAAATVAGCRKRAAEIGVDISQQCTWLAGYGWALFVYVCARGSYLAPARLFAVAPRAQNKKRRAVALNKYYAWCGACSVCIKAARVFPFYPRSKAKAETGSLSAVIKVW
jgi:hypothetical protein